MPASGSTSSFPSPDASLPAAAGRARQLQILSTRLVTSIFAGSYKSVFRGRGIEFEELREYQPGDDIRSIDWNVTARFGRPFIKRFAEEREMTVMLMLDCSASMTCPSPRRSKNEAALEVCALLAGTAARSNDRIGLLTFGGQVERYLPPGKGVRHARRLIAELVSHATPDGGTDMAGTLDYLQRITRRPVILFIVSDFLCPDFSAALAAAALRHDVVAVGINDPHDLELPNVGLVQIRDAETGLQRLVDSGSAKVRRAYSRLAADRQTALSRMITAAGAELLTISTAAAPVQALGRFFQARRRRLRVTG